MRTEEDEAFDELARRQGMWGGGFPAKRAMAADKMQEPWNEDEWRRNNWRCSHGWLRGEQCEICNAPQPAQEPVARVSGTHGGRFVYDPINRALILPVGMALYSAPQPCPTCEALAQPAQEPVAWEQFYPDIGKPQIALNAEVVGYVAPQREWVGLTEDEMSMIGYAVNGDEFEAMRLAEAKLKDKNG